MPNFSIRDRKGAGIDAEKFRGTLLAMHNPVGSVQSPQDVIALRVLKRLCR